jgi:cytoskeletal protein CcmA (bactofilin family)
MANSSKNILHNDVEIRGNLKCAGDLAFDGKIEGDLITDNALDLGENTVIKGNIAAASAVIRGRINGNVVAKDRLEIKGRSEVVGDIKAAKLVIEEGVAFAGRAEINPGKTPPAAAAPAASSGRSSEPYKGPLLGGHAR